ncbi:MAG: hypothetical protein COA69_09020 [Robiginitomaculum sp.]|nr:MAG: hypothetical protein COA69_09020 [Robiginitomaculum sp.]
MGNEAQKSAPKADIESFDGFLEDIFGLNMKEVKTLWTSIRRPKDYYQAAWIQDWGEKFTPSFRLWFTLIALTFFFQFFWASNDSPLVQLFAQLLGNVVDAGGVSLPEDVTTKAASAKFIRWYFGFIPVCSTIFLLLFSGIYRAWNRKTPYVVRQRNVFATIIPSTFIGLFLMMFNKFISPEHLVTFSSMTGVIVVSIDCLTAYRGAFPHTSIWGRLWRAIVLSVSILTVTTLAAVTANLLTMISLVIYYG